MPENSRLLKLASPAPAGSPGDFGSRSEESRSANLIQTDREASVARNGYQIDRETARIRQEPIDNLTPVVVVESGAGRFPRTAGP